MVYIRDIYEVDLVVICIIEAQSEAQASKGGASGKNLPANAGDQETLIRSLGRKDPLEEEMATHSSILAWKIPWTEEPGRL